MNKLFAVLLIVCVFCGRIRAADATRLRLEATPRQDEANGPTIALFGEGGQYPENRLADFMYFVPLISPVTVTSVISVDNNQVGYLLSYERQEETDSFSVSCEFRMKGKGFYLNKFDPNEMVERNAKSADQKKMLKDILDYIKFEGEGYGRIVAKGTINDSNVTVEEVDVHFDARGAQSPVTVGLYDVDIANSKDGNLNRYDYKVARVSTLSFNKNDGTPRMGIKISAVGKDEESLGAWEQIKGYVGNFFIKPIEIDKLGNETMLEFGLGLYNKEAKFTFPKAKNLVQTQDSRHQTPDSR